MRQGRKLNRGENNKRNERKGRGEIAMAREGSHGRRRRRRRKRRRKNENTVGEGKG